jgi:hypothetical protein
MKLAAMSMAPPAHEPGYMTGFYDSKYEYLEHRCQNLVYISRKQSTLSQTGYRNLRRQNQASDLPGGQNAEESAKPSSRKP